jgi:anti-sigma regulatory factor (Ser/Thr protein kinase)
VSATRTFAPVAASVVEVRRFLRDELQGLPARVVDVATLLSSELATNVVRHALVPYVVEVQLADRSIGVRVTDHGGGHPVQRSPEVTETTGRGILIVDALSDGWGIVQDASTAETTVWFRLHLDAAASEA